MRRSIATVSLSGMLREKLQAIAADLGLAIDMFQPDTVNLLRRDRETATGAAATNITRP